MASKGTRSVSSQVAADQLVDLVAAIVEQELEKRDTVMVCTVYSKNEITGTYDLYLDAERTQGVPSLMKNIPNSTPMTFKSGDHVYVMRVRNQIAQSFIIGSAS